ncbi:MAG: ECF transporter S component [Promethearchaeia archaeon]
MTANLAEKSKEVVNPEKEASMSRKTQITIQIAGAAIFGALSLVLSAISTPIIPRIPGWGMAYFDPISLVWIACFFIFGVKSGLLCSGIGSVGLLMFDPTGVGSIFKFFATIPLILVPMVVLKLYNKDENGRPVFQSHKLSKPRNLIVSEGLGIIVRIILMVGLNVLFFMTIFSSFFDFVDLEFIGFGDVTGWSAIVLGAIIINSYQGVLDVLIPALLIFGTKLDERFEIW